MPPENLGWWSNRSNYTPVIDGPKQSVMSIGCAKFLLLSWSWTVLFIQLDVMLRAPCIDLSDLLTERCCMQFMSFSWKRGPKSVDTGLAWFSIGFPVKDCHIWGINSPFSDPLCSAFHFRWFSELNPSASTSDGCPVVLHVGMAYHILLVGGLEHFFIFP